MRLRIRHKNGTDAIHYKGDESMKADEFPSNGNHQKGPNTTSTATHVTESRNCGIGAGHRDILRGTDSSSICAACEKLGEYPACPYRSQIVDGGTPCCLIVRSDKNRRYFYKTFKQQQHQRKKPGCQNIHNS